MHILCARYAQDLEVRMRLAFTDTRILLYQRDKKVISQRPSDIVLL